MMVSIYPNINTTTGGTDLDIEAVLTGIKNGQWREQVELVRACETKTEQREAKKRVPYFTVSGTFGKRSDAGLKQHSGLVCLDADPDKNPGVDLLAKRRLIEADTFTYACSTSIGGEGWFAIVPIPTGHHEQSFRAVARFYRDTYGVLIDSLPDVSRPRFVSYDSDLYFNPQAPTFEETLDEPLPAKQPTRVAPQPMAVERTDTDTEAILLAIGVKMIREAVDGVKHAKVRDAAFLLGGYVGSGFVAADAAQAALYQAVLNKENVADLRNAEQAIRSGLVKGAQRPLLPDWLHMSVRRELREQAQSFGSIVTLAQQIAGKAHVPVEGVQAAIESIAQEQRQAPELLTFWNVIHKEGKRASEDTYRLTLSLDKFINWLADQGFRKVRRGTTYVTVQVVESVVFERDRGQLVDHVLQYLASLPFEFDNIYRFQVREQVLLQERKLFDTNFLQAVPNLEMPFFRDVCDTAAYFFRNAWVRVTPETIIAYPYEELPGVVWESQVRPHDFVLLDQQSARSSDFHQFMINVTGKDPERLAQLRRAMGYLLHGYKNKMAARVVILSDQVAAEGNPNGRTGKSLLMEAVSQLIKATSIEGATFRFEDDFRWSLIDPDTRLAYFDEWPGRKLSLSKMFSEITNKLVVNRKYLNPLVLYFHEAPKFAITTNDMVIGSGSSNAARKWEIPLAPHYSDRFTPLDEFGTGFFDQGWDADEYTRFFNLALGWVQQFLREGVVVLDSPDIAVRQLQVEAGDDFMLFAQELVDNGTGTDAFGGPEIWAGDAFLRFKTETNNHRLSLQRFNGWMMRFGFSKQKCYDAGPRRNQLYFLPPAPTSAESK